MTPTAEMIAGTYVACDECKEGIWVDLEDENIAHDPRVAKWGSEQHQEHAIRTVMATDFLSTMLSEGYKDPEHPDLEPIVLSFGGSVQNGTKSTLPAFKPGSIEDSIRANRDARHVQRAKTSSLPEPTFEATAPSDRPIRQTKIGGRNRFEGYFWQWFFKMDTGVPTNLIEFVEVDDESFEAIARTVFTDHYRIEIRTTALREDFQGAVNLSRLQRSAVSQVVAVATDQRFGKESDRAIKWLQDQLAETMISEKLHQEIIWRNNNP